MKAKEFIPASKPRNFVAKNQKTAGAGAHRDKKKEQKQGYEKHKGQGVAEGLEKNLSVQQLATISDEALDKAYGYGRSNPGNTFGWQANLMSAAYAKKMIDAGVTDIEKISDAIHKGWNVTAQKFVQNPDQFDDTEKLRQAGKLEAKLAQRAKLMKINYGQLDNEEQEKDRVVARALLKAIKGQQGMAEGDVMEYETHRYTDDQGNEWEVNDEGERTLLRAAPGSGYGGGRRSSRYNRLPRYKPYSVPSQQKKGMYFYNVNDPQTAQKLGLRQSKSGKWYLPAGSLQKDTADKVFGAGKYWEPKS